jgi:hypothetical protein
MTFSGFVEAIETRRAWPSDSCFAGKSRIAEYQVSVPAGPAMNSFLRTIVWFGAQQRYAAIGARK